MKKLVLVFIFTLLFSFSLNAHAVDLCYIGANAGLSIQNDVDFYEYEDDISYGIAGGYSFGNFRLEGELAYQKNDLDMDSFSGDYSGYFSHRTFLINGYFDILLDSAFQPFFTVGIGMTKKEVYRNYSQYQLHPILMPYDYSYTYSKEDKAFAYQLGVGVGYKAGESITIDLKYRYFGTGDKNDDGHQLLIGLRYGF